MADVIKNKANLILGLFLIGLAICLGIIYRFEYLPELVLTAMIAVGITFTIEHTLWDNLLNTVIFKVKGHLSESFSILDESQYNGLISVLAPLRDSNVNYRTNIPYSVQTKETVLAELQKSQGEISIMGISLLDFFGVEGTFYTYFQDVLVNNKSANFRVLMLSKEGEAIRLKSVLEGDYKENGFPRPTTKMRRFQIYGNIKDSIEHIDQLNTDYDKKIIRTNKKYFLKNGAELLEETCEKCGSELVITKDGKKVCLLENERSLRSLHPFIAYKFYDFMPPCRIILTESVLLIEQYAIAPIESLDFFNVKENISEQNSQCITGRVPIYKYNRGSNMYRLMKEQFDLLWSVNDQPITYENIANHLEKQSLMQNQKTN
jgi:hypothetical protein